MKHPDGFEVYVKSVTRGEAYTEYEAQGEAGSGNKYNKERYIEVGTGEQFAIVMNIFPNFDFGRFESVRLWFAIGSDDENKGWGQAQEVSEIKRAMKYNGIYNETLGTILGSHGRTLDSQDSKLVQLHFADVDFDEDISLTQIEAKQRLDRLGSIRVAVQRGSTYYLEEPESLDLSSHCLEGKESSKLRALGLTHAVNLVAQEGQVDTATERYDGIIEFKDFPNRKLGKPYWITYHYRSRKALQQLGIIHETSPILLAEDDGAPFVEEHIPHPNYDGVEQNQAESATPQVSDLFTPEDSVVGFAFDTRGGRSAQIAEAGGFGGERTSATEQAQTGADAESAQVLKQGSVAKLMLEPDDNANWTFHKRVAFYRKKGKREAKKRYKAQLEALRAKRAAESAAETFS